MSGLNWRVMCLLLSASMLLAGCIPMVQRLSDSPPVTGQVLDAHTGEPIAGVRVQVLRRDGVSGPATLSDARGDFSLPEQDRLRLFLAMPGVALDHVWLTAVERSGDADPSPRVGYGTAIKWLRQPAPAREDHIVILMLPRESGGAAAQDVAVAPPCDYTFRILDMLPELLGSDWFTARLVADRDVGRRYAETLDYFARLAMRECGGHPRSEAHREALEHYRRSLTDSP